MNLRLGGSSVAGAQYALYALRQRSYHLGTRQLVAGSPLSTCVAREGLSSLQQSRGRVSLPRVLSVPRGRYVSTYPALCVSTADGTVTATTAVEDSKATATINQEPCSVVEASSDADLTALETSSLAKWASDAATTLDSTDLPAQGDLASLGLCANTPVGWLQWMMEYIHVHTGLPWWGAIVVSTFILRAAIFPLVMKVQKNGVLMNNVNPEIQELMKKQREFRQMGNETFANQYSHKIWSVYQKNNCNPLKAAVLPLIQLPLFLSFFIAIRRMATVPVESMKTGGMLWFEDLTVPDPYYILPVLACGSFVASIELGGETGVGNPQTAKLKNVFRLMPIILIPITASFPSGLFMYWLPASFISIAQILLLKVGTVRAYFGIPQIVHHPPDPRDQSKGVMGSFKENYSSNVAIAEAKKRRRDIWKRYKQLRKNPRPKLYDEPPHLIKEKE